MTENFSRNELQEWKAVRLPVQRTARMVTRVVAHVVFACGLLLGAVVVWAQEAPTFLERAHRLPEVTRVLVTGAHPDDEPSALLVDLSLGQSVDCAYLSATRGEGGQDLIGPELFDALGIIRTEELLAARRYDHCEQFFTRAYDFGFSKDPQETFRKWGREETLGDMVRVIRRYRPDVVISVWSGTPADGHGHHQAVGILTPEAVRAAGDPAQFPDQLKQGLRVWKVKRLYVLSRGARTPGVFSVDVGQYSPVLGKSFTEIAARGRNQHESQGEGAPEYKGPLPVFLKQIPPDENSGGTTDAREDYLATLNAGISSWIEFADRESDRVPFLKDDLAAIDTLAQAIARHADDENPAASIPEIVKGIQLLRALRHKVLASGLGEANQSDLSEHLRWKEQDFVETLNAALGLSLDARSAEAGVAPAEKTALTATLLNRSHVRVEPVSIDVDPQRSWTVKKESGELKPLGYNESLKWQFSAAPHAEAAPTEMYWLRLPRKGDRYDVADPTMIGRAENRPELSVTATYRLENEDPNTTFQITEPVEYVHIDPRYGQREEDVRIIPALSVSMAPDSLVVPTPATVTTRNVFVRIENERAGKMDGTVKLILPRGWKSIPIAAAFSAAQQDDVVNKKFEVRIPVHAAEGDHPILAVATVGEQNFSRGSQIISYPHIHSQVIYHPAQTTARVLNLKVPAGMKVGYVMGTGDRVPEALEQMGIQVTLLTDQALATSALASFDAIVTGIRAFDVRRDLRQNNARLLEYVRQGGTLIVEYNSVSFGLKPELLRRVAGFSVQGVAQSSLDAALMKEWKETNGPQSEEKLPRFADPTRQFGPYIMLRGALTDRVVDETAPVKILAPRNPIFTTPNRITEADFNGWVQERGLYFMKAWDARYTPLLASHDPGENDLLGGMLFAKYGKGNYVMTDYAWFRQLPAGVHGAYRIFANMLSLARSEKRKR